MLLLLCSNCNSISLVYDEMFSTLDGKMQVNEMETIDGNMKKEKKRECVCVREENNGGGRQRDENRGQAQMKWFAVFQKE